VSSTIIPIMVSPRIYGQMETRPITGPGPAADYACATNSCVVMALA
jgi:hypothetical protein